MRRVRPNLNQQRADRAARDRYLAAIGRGGHQQNQERLRQPEYVEIDGEIMLADDRDGKAFKAYVREVEHALKKLDGLVTIRQIKIALGEHLVERWLLDALATSYHVLHVPAYVDRFAYVEKLSVRKNNETNGIQVEGTRKRKEPDWIAF